jgi:2',3'-cyclic-nucleotide 2'-phosphodiesterase (5'-nucleotidase family)
MHFLYKRLLVWSVPLLMLSACGRQYHITQQKAQFYKVSNTAADSSFVRFLQPYKEQLDVKMSEVIGSADTTLTKKQPECSLGNFMADAQFWSARSIDPTVNVSVVNYGGIRISYLQQGPIEVRKMYELMPFDNIITVIEIPGSVLQEFCDHMASLKGWPVSGLSYTIKDKKAINVMVNDKPLQAAANYKVALSDYIANGGDNCHFLKPYMQNVSGILIREALISYVKLMTGRNTRLTAKIENRVTNAE